VVGWRGDGEGAGGRWSVGVKKSEDETRLSSCSILVVHLPSGSSLSLPPIRRTGPHPSAEGRGPNTGGVTCGGEGVVVVGRNEELSINR
jgi:hypothetical protein